MPEFTSPWLEIGKTSSSRTDTTDGSASVSGVSDTTGQKQPYQRRDAFDETEVGEISALIAELPPSDEWSIDETVARILAMNDAERATYYTALIHDWRAWRLAMEQFSASKGAAA